MNRPFEAWMYRAQSETYGSVRIFWPRFSRDELIEQLRSRMPLLAAELPLARVSLFGPWAEGRATVRTEIDVLVIYRGPAHDNVYRLVLEALDTPGVELHIYTEEEAATVQQELDRMLETSVPLYPPAPAPADSNH